jgi:uncharacterized membrane protein YkvA (DUF1232 family)
VFDRLRTQGDWLHKLAVTSDALGATHFGEKDAHVRLTHPGHRHILAALFYLCDHKDVIPDYEVSIGYVDDAIVMNRCLVILRNRWRTLYATAQHLSTSR